MRRVINDTPSGAGALWASRPGQLGAPGADEKSTRFDLVAYDKVFDHGTRSSSNPPCCDFITLLSRDERDAIEVFASSLSTR
jgi:hypothetical protein